MYHEPRQHGAKASNATTCEYLYVDRLLVQWSQVCVKKAAHQGVSVCLAETVWQLPALWGLTVAMP